MTDFMIDIETASTTRQAAIIQIGVVAVRQGIIVDGLDLKVNIKQYSQSDLKQKFDVDIATMMWWATQDKSTRDTVFGDAQQTEREPLFHCLEELSSFFGRFPKKKKVWAKPPSFDLEILQHAYRVLGLPCPWHYSEERDLRTLLDMTNSSVRIHGKPVGVRQSDGLPRNKHDAFDDAEHQAEQLILCLDALGRVKR